MRRTSGPAQLTFRPDRLVCPAYGYGALRSRGPLSRSAKCYSCCRTFDGVTVGSLKQIVALPDAIGKHACECGHAEMRSLPDGMFHCPACRSEVMPAGPNLCAVASHAEEGEQRKGARIAGRGKESRAGLVEDHS